ncbi:MAG: peptidoglycan peptidase [Alphaproteobacteria bacterium]|nr:MAG: peptidoglycan peptidase [Alphaproteobacteria bacterium]
MKKIIIFLVLCSLLVAGGFFANAHEDYPALRNGDLVFQTSSSKQSPAIFVASASPFTHMGMIKKDGTEFVVIEALSTVQETPLNQWIDRGVLNRVAIYRDPQLTSEQAQQIISSATTYYGKPYDEFFSFHNDALYCSELPYLAYKTLGHSLGTVQKVSELNFDNMLVKKMIKQRWKNHPECKTENYNFEQCYERILHQELITPAAIANDARLEKIYSNYPF